MKKIEFIDLREREIQNPKIKVGEWIPDTIADGVEPIKAVENLYASVGLGLWRESTNMATYHDANGDLHKVFVRVIE